MNIKIEDYYAALKSADEKRIAASKAKKESIQKELVNHGDAIRTLESEKKKKERLQNESQAEGLDATKLTEKIKELEEKIAAEHKITESLEVKLKGAGQASEQKRNFDREDLMVRIMQTVCGCSEATEVNGLGGSYPLLCVNVAEHDQHGRPIKCAILIGGSETKTLTIKPSSRHFLKDFRPEGLKWLPLDSDSSKNGKDDELEQDGYQAGRKFRAFFDTKSEKFILSKTELTWRTRAGIRRRSSHPYEEEQVWEDCKDDFSDIAVSLDAHLDESIEAEKGELDLEKKYVSNPFLTHLRERISTLTTSKPMFKPCTEHALSTDIYARIKNDWDALIKCPWSDSVLGTLALLKYHVENGEKARFWSKAFENQYGFRLRTRDHDWIVGSIYVSNLQKAASGKEPITVHKAGAKKREHYDNGSPWVASLGRMFLTVDGDGVR